MITYRLHWYEVVVVVVTCLRTVFYDMRRLGRWLAKVLS